MSEYKVGDKFVIEVGEIYETSEQFGVEEGSPVELFKIKGFNSLVFDKNGLDKLQKYDAGYNKGLQDAWELAKKIRRLSFKEAASIYDIDINGMTGGEVIKKIFDLTPQEALAKFEAYEKKQEKIKVGDVVEHTANGYKFLVTEIRDELIIGYRNSGGECSFIYPNRYIKKTGKHIDINDILQQIS